MTSRKTVVSDQWSVVRDQWSASYCFLPLRPPGPGAIGASSGGNGEVRTTAIRPRFWTLALFALSLSALAQSARDDKPTESAYLTGPAGLEGWTLDYPFPDRPEDRYPHVLVVSRKGRVIRKITGQHYIWNWIFWSEGRQVAYEDGPPHFVMRCILADVATGRQLANIDCFHELPPDSPLWAKTLEMHASGK